MSPHGYPFRSTGRPLHGPIVLGRPDMAGVASADPWELWQPVTAPGEYTCARCGQDKTGERFVGLEAAGAFDPTLARGPDHITRALSRVQRRILCPECRWAKPKPVEKPKRRRTELD